MADNQQFIAARIRLNALSENLPSFPSEKHVADYHSILKDIQASSTYDLSAFTIPDDQVDRKVVGARPASFSGRPGSKIYSTDKRCDHDYFARQVLGACRFLNEMSKTAQPASTDPRDYWSKSDEELITLATGYGIGYGTRPYLAGPGRSPALDRDKLITKLLERDQTLAGHHPGNVTVNIHGPVSGSTIQAASPHATASASSTIDLVALADIISKLRAEKPNLTLSNSVSQQFDLNIQTLEREAQRPTPNRSIILQCLNDAKNILVAVGTGVASNAVWAALSQFLS
jgi:hypothetical protein